MVVGSSLAPHMSFLIPLTGSTGPAVHLYGLTGSICESKLGHLQPYAWCPRVVQECSFNVNTNNWISILA